MERGSRSDISYAVHQCARFCSDPKKEHGQAIRWLGRYLRHTRDKGTVLKPNLNKGLEVYVDADFAGNFDKTDTQNREEILINQISSQNQLADYLTKPVNSDILTFLKKKVMGW